MPAPALSPLREDLIDALADALAAPGWAVRDDLLPPDLAKALATEARSLAATGALRAAGIGRGAGQHARRELRGDATLWLDDPACGQPAAVFLALVDALRQGLNQRLMLGLHSIEAHYAHYPVGARYARHRDRFRDDDARVVSMVAYLNPDWRPGDGGELRLYLPDGGHEVAPRFGRVALFLSAEVEHEVLPTRADRYSIAGWFRRRGAGPLDIA